MEAGIPTDSSVEQPQQPTEQPEEQPEQPDQPTAQVREQRRQSPDKEEDTQTSKADAPEEESKKADALKRFSTQNALAGTPDPEEEESKADAPDSEEEEEEEEEPPEPEPLKEGDRVILDGLKKNPSLNGLKGKIIKVRKNKKYDIKLDNGDGRNNISEKYLRRGRAKVSKKSSYYFFKSTDAEQAKQYVPQKISPSKISKSKVKKGGLSSWNQRGATWEDRNLDDWSFKKIRSLFSNLKVEAENSSKITMDADDVSGDASVVFSRKGPRIGYDLIIKGTVTGEYCDKEVNGKFEISEMDENNFKDNDYEFEISGVPFAVKSKLKEALRPVVHSTFETFVEDMKKECEH